MTSSKPRKEKTNPGGKELRPKTSRGKIRRQEILKAARRVFSSHPYPKASMRMIAKEAGLDYHLILYYFPTKADLFRAVLREVHDEFTQAMPEWFEGIDRLSPPQAISAYFSRSLGFHRKHREFSRIILLNMVQSVSKPELIPGYEYIQRATQFARMTFGAKSRFEISPEQMDYLTTAISLLVIALIGGSEYHAETRGLDADSDTYHDWVKNVIVFMVLAVLKTFQEKDHRSGNVEGSTGE